MVRALEESLGAHFHVAPDGLGQLNGAYGAAFLGLRRVEKLLAEGKRIPPTAAQQSPGPALCAPSICDGRQIFCSAVARPLFPGRKLRGFGDALALLVDLGGEFLGAAGPHHLSHGGQLLHHLGVGGGLDEIGGDAIAQLR